MTAKKEKRMQELIGILQRHDLSSVAELAIALDVTEMTIRRDLETLEKDGILERFHGGARLSVSSSYEPPLRLRARLHAEDKQRLAQAVSALLRDGDTVILDGGSTGIAIARALRDRHLTVCPLSVRVAWEFEQSSTITLRMPPGVARAHELSLSGQETIDHLQRFRFDHFIMTASGFSPASGFTEWNLDDAAVKRAAIASAKQTTAAVDASKYGREAFAQVCDLATPGLVLVSGLTDDEVRAAIRAEVAALSEV